MIHLVKLQSTFLGASPIDYYGTYFRVDTHRIGLLGGNLIHIFFLGVSTWELLVSGYA